MSRRQNSSCDQCRKGKRACDAVWLRDRQLQRSDDKNTASSSHGPGASGAPVVGSAAAAAAAAGGGGGGAAAAPAPDDQPFDLVGPCTNCARTNKHCTFEWVQSQHLQRKERQTLSASSSFGPNTSHPPSLSTAAGAPTNEATTILGAPAALPPSSSSSSSSSSIPSTTIATGRGTGSQSPIPLRPLAPSPYVDALHHPHQPSYSSFNPATDEHISLQGCQPYPTTHDPHGFVMSGGGGGPPPPPPGVNFPGGPTASFSSSAPHMDVLGAPCFPMTTSPTNGASTFMDVFTDYGLSAATATDFSAPPSNNGFVALDDGWSSPVASLSSVDEHQHQHQHQHHQQQQLTRKRRRTQSSASIKAMTNPWPDISASSARLSRLTNGTMVGETMMRIYHDVMEGALSCWLVEQTCPYNSVPSTPTSTSSSSPPAQSIPNQQHQQIWGSNGGNNPLPSELDWGPDWSNRVYRRVIKLDRMAHQLGLRRLSATDERRASQALNSAVMAFTAQWAQSSRRSSARWPMQTNRRVQTEEQDSDDENYKINNPAADMADEFDRTLQKTFWNQARRALDECSDVDSFRVVFAEIIFGLTQKYAEEAQFGRDRNDSCVDDGAKAAVEDILREDNQSIWLERATRRLHVLRRRVELYDKQANGRNHGGHSAYDAECRKTVDLLFWLVIMFDTISAAMTERPLTVSDEDSSNLALATYNAPPAAPGATTAQRWNIILARDRQTKHAPLRWPCTDEAIAQELTDAAPVKVLLYRKVTRLQTLVARDPVDPAVMDDAIEDALMVYGHWNGIYGALFADCIAHHLLLSARIQSWYVCLFGHWLLATLLLADLIETVDRRGLGDEAARRRRIQDGVAAGVRRASSWLISDLARASTPRHDDRLGELESFHHAVNEGALLTEPWTMILIRTFSRAAIMLLEEASVPMLHHHETDNSRNGLNEHYDRGSAQRCEDCIKALWYLGKKSDMAREIAHVLGGALQRTRLRSGSFEHGFMGIGMGMGVAGGNHQNASPGFGVAT